jgi:phosphate transport system substrate-binding protein
MYQLADQSKNRITDLELSPRTLCGIFTGQLTNWSDPAIVADTRHPMPDTTIYPVIRADSSGQSLVLSEYCIDQAEDLWDGFIDSLNKQGGESSISKEPTANWPGGWGRVRAEQYAEGVADTVADQSNDGAIGYVEIADAGQRHIPVASVKNASGAFTQPTGANVSNALKFASVRPDGTHVLDFKGPGADVYNPSTYSYLIAPTTGLDSEKGLVLGTFLNYVLTKGQAKAVPQGYAPLPPNLVAAGLEATQKIPGAPARPASDINSSEGNSSLAGEVASGLAGSSGRPTPAVATTAGSTLGEAAPEGLDTGVVTPAVGPLGATGGEHVLLALAGVGLALGGEGIRRSKAPPAS